MKISHGPDLGKMTNDQRVAPKPGLIRRDVGDELFVLMPDSTVHWFRNATAVALWRAIEAGGPTGISVSALATGLARDFVVAPEDALRDVRAFVSSLAERGLAATSQPPQNPEGGD